MQFICSREASTSLEVRQILKSAKGLYSRLLIYGINIAWETILIKPMFLDT